MEILGILGISEEEDVALPSLFEEGNEGAEGEFFFVLDLLLRSSEVRAEEEDVVFRLLQEGQDSVDSCEACGRSVCGEGNVEVYASENAAFGLEGSLLQKGHLEVQVFEGEGGKHGIAC